MRYAVSPAPPRARGARAAAQSRNGCGFKQKPAQREPNDSPSGANHSFLSLSRFACFMMQRIANSPELPSRRAGGGFGHPDRVVPNATSDTQYRPLHREHGAFGHSVRGVSIDTCDTQYRPLHREHADAARAGQSENGCGFKQKPAQREPNDSPSGANHSFLSLSRFACFMMQRIANSPELPSRRAGGGFGHPDRVVPNATCDTQYRPLRREHAGPARQRSRGTVVVLNKSPLKENRTIRPAARIIRFSLYRVSRAL